MLLIVLCAVFIFTETNGELSGRSQNLVGGTETLIGEFPFMVSILYHNRHSCGGSILNEYYIITAAHCVLEKNPSSFSVRAGSSYRSKGGRLYRASAIFYHPEYTRKIKTHDIGIIQLAEPLNFGASVQPVRLFDSDLRVDGGEEVVTIGWGRKGHRGKPSEILEKIRLNLFNPDICKKSFNRKITFTMLCAAAPNKDGCQGDSGGPLLRDGELFGVASWGIGCADPRYPGVYTSITTEKDYISKITGL